jgi:DNA repair protein RecO (recombination protein O)
MPARESESLVLRTYPFGEADLIVSFIARDQGKLRGAAKGVRRPKNRFGSGLERLPHIRLFYYERENRDLARLDRCELLSPPLFLRADYATSVALDFLAEVSDQLLPEHEPNDAFFRLLLLVLEDLRVPAGNGEAAAENGTETESTLDATARLWRALTYFLLWSVKLGGWLSPLTVCAETGRELAPDETAFYAPGWQGIYAPGQRRGGQPLAGDSRAIAAEMLRKPLPKLDPAPWTRATAADLRRYLLQVLEEQFERRIKTAEVLEQI